MNSISRLPVVQIYNLLDSPKRNQKRQKHKHPLDLHVPHLNKQMCHECQQQSYDRIQESNCKPLYSELQFRPLIEEYGL
uniref:Uncharacterized protein n=1 Tax=Nelumbo nucifera TaxID=4432 RepID=A0A822XTF7_NELNU|nr:TPA_asm: hypothetical protein HUJ06_024764 [Nelumbo nucifera]